MNQYENKPQDNNMNEDNAQLTTQDSAVSETDSARGEGSGIDTKAYEQGDQAGYD